LATNPTVQLLHFPPDYVLTRTQDYLAAHTTMRWSDLLAMNGVNKEITPRYQAIVDIAPIAAPANAGQSLAGTYDYFTSYAMALLAFWLPSESGQNKPLVAFGGPVRDWIRRELHADLKVSDVATVSVPSVGSVNIFAANHPSLLYNAANNLTPNKKPTMKAVATLSRIMEQDLVGACWQARMGSNTANSPVETAKACKTTWANKPAKMCKLVLKQAYDRTEEQADEFCATMDFKLTNKVTDAQIMNLEKKIRSITIH